MTFALLGGEYSTLDWLSLRQTLAEERAVLLDGGVATELQRLRPLRGVPGPDPVTAK